MFGTKPFDLLDPWKGNQLAMICLYRAINDFNQTVSMPMIDYINQISFLPQKSTWLQLVMHKFHDEDVELIDYALENYTYDILHENRSAYTIITKLWQK